MKTTRTLLLISIILLTLLLFKTCGEKGYYLNEEEVINTFVLLISIILLTLLLFRNCREKECYLNEEEVINTFVNSRHIISIEDTKDLYNNYKDRFIPEIKGIQVEPGEGIFRPNYLPTEYSLIPLQKLKDYINFLDILQEKNPNQIISGVAINFGAYNLNKQINDKTSGSKLKNPIRNGDHAGRITSYLTPTFYNDRIVSDYDGDNHIPFCIDYDDVSDKFKGTFVPLRKLIDSGTDDLNSDNPKQRLMERTTTNTTTTTNKTNTLDDDLQSAASNEFNAMPPKQ